MPKTSKIVWKRSYNDREQSVFKSACGRFLIEEVELPKTARSTVYRCEWRYSDLSTQYWTAMSLLRSAKNRAESALKYGR